MRTLFRSRLPLVMPALALLVAGCQAPTYTVIEHLPDPPALAGPTAAVLESKETDPSPLPATAERDIPAGWIPTVRERSWRHIVIHHSATEAGNACRFDELHRTVRGWDELGYHFVITNGHGGPDGAIEVGSRWTKQKWGAHTGGTKNNEYNDLGIGICLVGNFETADPTPAQLQSLQGLLDFLTARYNIGAADIIGHCQAPEAHTACPGRRLLTWMARRNKSATPDRVTQSPAADPQRKADPE